MLASAHSFNLFYLLCSCHAELLHLLLKTTDLLLHLHSLQFLSNSKLEDATVWQKVPKETNRVMLAVESNVTLTKSRHIFSETPFSAGKWFTDTESITSKHLVFVPTARCPTSTSDFCFQRVTHLIHQLQGSNFSEADTMTLNDYHVLLQVVELPKHPRRLGDPSETMNWNKSSFVSSFPVLFIIPEFQPF